ncbi:hypothetical protein BGW80DRAFT_416287 [Lactifluus volemus]|nr:hypothetical protein BGW80DRAFT_416287 [Lactifluus volemus]
MSLSFLSSGISPAPRATIVDISLVDEVAGLLIPISLNVLRHHVSDDSLYYYSKSWSSIVRDDILLCVTGLSNTNHVMITSIAYFDTSFHHNDQCISLSVIIALVNQRVAKRRGLTNISLSVAPRANDSRQLIRSVYGFHHLVKVRLVAEHIPSALSTHILEVLSF